MTFKKILRPNYKLKNVTLKGNFKKKNYASDKKNDTNKYFIFIF